MCFSHSAAIRVALFCLIPLALAPARASAQTETLTATASVKNADGVSVSAPLTITVRRFATDAQRDAVLAAVRRGGTAAAQTLLATQEDAGSLQLGGRQTPIKYAYARAAGSGRLITVITAEPIALTDERARSAQAAGRTVGLVLLETAGSTPGTGELVPSAAVRANDQGAIVTDSGSADTIRLTNVVKK